MTYTLCNFAWLRKALYEEEYLNEIHKLIQPNSLVNGTSLANIIVLRLTIRVK